MMLFARGAKGRMKLFIVVIAGFLLSNILVCAGVAEETEKLQLLPWTSADIDWTQFTGTHLRVCSTVDPYDQFLSEHLGIFEQLTGMKVSYEMYEEMTMRRKRTLDLSRGTGLYDIVSCGSHYVGQVGEGRWLAPLEPFITNPQLTDSDWFKFKDISESARDALTYPPGPGGNLLAIPIAPSNTVLWYRTDLLGEQSKYGIPVPDSWEEVIQTKRKLKGALESDGIEDVYGFASRGKRGAGMNTYPLTQIVMSYGTDWLDENYNSIFNEPPAVRAITTYRDAITGYGSPPGGSDLHFLECCEMFAAEKLAMWLDGMDFIFYFNDPNKSKVVDVWEATLPPCGPDPQDRWATIWAWALGINHASEHKEAAWLFLEWAASEPMLRLAGTGICPSRKKVWDSRDWKELGHPKYLEAVKFGLALEGGSRLRRALPEFPEAGEAISVACNEIFRGAPAQETLDEAADKVNMILTRTGRRKSQ